MLDIVTIYEERHTIAQLKRECAELIRALEAGESESVEGIKRTVEEIKALCWATSKLLGD